MEESKKKGGIDPGMRRKKLKNISAFPDRQDKQAGGIIRPRQHDIDVPVDNAEPMRRREAPAKAAPPAPPAAKPLTPEERRKLLVKTIKRIMEEEGMKIFLDAYLFSAMFRDYAPQLKEEILFWSIALEHEYGKIIILHHDDPKTFVIKTYQHLKNIFTVDTIKNMFTQPLGDLYHRVYFLSELHLEKPPCVKSISFYSVQDGKTALVWFAGESVPANYINDITAYIRFQGSVPMMYGNVSVNISGVSCAVKLIDDRTCEAVLKLPKPIPLSYQKKWNVNVTVTNSLLDETTESHTIFTLTKGQYYQVRKITSVEEFVVHDSGNSRFISLRIGLPNKPLVNVHTNCWLRIFDERDHAVCDRITQVTIPAGESACYVSYGGADFSGWKAGTYSYEISLYGSNILRGTFSIK